MKQMLLKKNIIIILWTIVLFIGKSEGFFLKTILSETVTEEPTVIFTTMPSTDTTTNTPNAEIYRNHTQNSEESIQKLNSVQSNVRHDLGEDLAESQTNQTLNDEINHNKTNLKGFVEENELEISTEVILRSQIDEIESNKSMQTSKMLVLDKISKGEEQINLGEETPIEKEESSIASTEPVIEITNVKETTDISPAVPNQTTLSSFHADIAITTPTADISPAVPNPTTLSSFHVDIATTTETMDISDAVPNPTTLSAIYEDIVMTTPTLAIEDEINDISLNVLDHQQDGVESSRIRQMRGFGNEKSAQSSEILEDSTKISLSDSSASNSSMLESIKTHGENHTANINSVESGVNISKQIQINVLKPDIALVTFTEKPAENKITTSVDISPTPKPRTTVETVILPQVTIKSKGEGEVPNSAEKSRFEKDTEKEITTQSYILSTQKLKNDQFQMTTKILTKTDDEDSIEIIEGITESTVDVADVTIQGSESKHIVMKKPGVDNKLLLQNVTEESISILTETRPENETDTTKIKNTIDEAAGIELTTTKPLQIMENDLEVSEIESNILNHYQNKISDTTVQNQQQDKDVVVNNGNEVFKTIENKLTPRSGLTTLDTGNSSQNNKVTFHQDSNLQNLENVDEETDLKIQKNKTIFPEENLKTSTELPPSNIESSNDKKDIESLRSYESDTDLLGNEISKHLEDNNFETSPATDKYSDLNVGHSSLDNTTLSRTEDEISTEEDIRRSNEVETSTENPLASAKEGLFVQLTTELSLDTVRLSREDNSAVSDVLVYPAASGRSSNTIIAEGLGKPLPTRSVGDAPLSSSYSSEDKTTTVLVLCAATGGIFVAFSLAIYLITFQRQHGTLDIELQEQQCGKDDLENDEDSETRVSLLNQPDQADSDEHSSD